MHTSIKNTKKRAGSLFLLFVFTILPLIAQDSQFFIKNYSKADYSAGFQNWNADKGPDNYVYIANNNGLLVFDGVNWEFLSKPEINNLRAVKVDQQTGRIYTAGYRELGFWEWDRFGKLNYTSLTPKAEAFFARNEEFWNIAIKEGNTYFQSFHGLFIYEGDTIRIINSPGFLNSISELNDQLLLHVRDKGIYRISENNIVPYLISDFFEDKLIRFILPFNNRNLLIGCSENGLFRYDGHSFVPALPEYQEYFISNNINRGELLGSDTILIGTLLDGVVGISLSNMDVFHINKEHGLQNNTVLDILPMEDNFLVTLDRGLSYVNLHPGSSYEIKTLTDIGAVYTAAMFENKLYLGTNQGLYYRDSSIQNGDFILVPGTQDQVWDCKIFDNTLFVGHNSGTFTIKNGKLKQISHVTGGFRTIKNSFQVNSLIQSTYSDLVMYKKENSEWALSHRIQNFSDLIRYIELDHLNHIWAGHMRRGIYKLKLNDRQDSVIDSRYYGKESVFKKDYGIDVFKLENRIIFTTGELIYTYDDINDSIIPFQTLNNAIGAFSKSHRIVKGNNHHYWFLSKKAIGLFHFKQNEIQLIQSFPAELFGNHTIEGYENLIPSGETDAIYCLENGYALLKANPGITNDTIPIPRLKPRKIAMADRNGNETLFPLEERKLNIPYKNNSLHLQYACPDYSSRKLVYQYKIDGLNLTWSEPSEKGIFNINRIPPGDYRIYIKAKNEWGIESEAYILQLNMMVPWYRSIYALLAYLIILAILIIYIRYEAIKNVRDKEKKIQDEKEQELIRLRNQNLRTELTFKSQELANSTMSIIKKNEFLLNLKDIFKEQKYQLGTRYPDKYYQYIQKKIDRNISSGDDWKIFETNVEKAHEFFIQKLIREYPQLTHSDLKLCTYLRMNLSSKEIAPLMKISVRGVENHRYRLRKKLDLASTINLTDFILAFEV